MGGQKCPNCSEGFLTRTGKGRKRCRHCGYLKHDSYGRKEQGTILYPKEEEKAEEDVEEEEIPAVRDVIPVGEGYHTEDYKAIKFMRDKQHQLRNKARSIEKILAKLKKNKYSGIKEIMIEGELWDVESGELVRLKDKPKTEEKEEFIPEDIIEEMVTKEEPKE